MAKHLTINCTVSPDGRIPLVYGERVRDVLKILAGMPIQISIEDQKRYSTNPQRQYYFGVIVTQFQEYFAAHGQWIDKDDLHDMMMKHIGQLWIEQPDPFSETIEKKRRSYNGLSTMEAENYHTQCRAEAARRGFDIPEPNEEAAPRYIDREAPPALEAPVIEQPKSYLQHYLDNEEGIPK